MKKVVFLVSVFVLAQLLPLDSFAQQQYYTLQEVREQTPQRWTQSYETKWRTVDIDVQPIIPDVDTMPVLGVKAAYWQPEAGILGEEWNFYEFGDFRYICNDVHGVAKATNGRLRETFFIPPYDYERAYLFESNFTLQDATDCLQQLFDEAGLSFVEYHYDMPELFSVSDYLDANGNLIADASYYFLSFAQHLRGIPILSHFHDGKQGYPDNEPYLNSFLRAYYKSPNVALINCRFITETKQLAEDIPLCDYSVIQAALEEKITNGRLRRIFDMDLGYVLFNEPGTFKTEETNMGTKLPFYAVPTWRVNCYYVQDGKTELRDYTGQDVIERGTREYGALMINAQTGEVYDRFDDSAHSADYAGFISWEDANSTH